ncbi:MAG: amidohydrolase family protein [Pseudomonadota bacterium]
MNIFDEPKIDCHNHVFDPARFPYRADAVYCPQGQEVGTAATFSAALDAYGVRHALLVGPVSGYGTDNRCLLDALHHGEGRFKGIAMVEHDAGIAQLRALKDAGVVGVAFNAAMDGTAAVAGADLLFGRLAELEMFAQIQVEGDQLTDLLGVIGRSGVRVLIDHCGRPDAAAAAGIGQAGFQALLALAAGGRTYVKLSGMQKYSRAGFPYPDARPYVDALLSAFGPDACVWGSDWPFLRASERIDYGPLLKLAEQLMPDPDVRRRVMWETPRRLFGFDER